MRIEDIVERWNEIERTLDSDPKEGAKQTMHLLDSSIGYVRVPFDDRNELINLIGVIFNTIRDVVENQKKRDELRNDWWASDGEFWEAAKTKGRAQSEIAIWRSYDNGFHELSKIFENYRVLPS